MKPVEGDVNRFAGAKARKIVWGECPSSTPALYPVIGFYFYALNHNYRHEIVRKNTIFFLQDQGVLQAGYHLAEFLFQPLDLGIQFDLPVELSLGSDRGLPFCNPVLKSTRCSQAVETRLALFRSDIRAVSSGQ